MVQCKEADRLGDGTAGDGVEHDAREAGELHLFLVERNVDRALARNVGSLQSKFAGSLFDGDVRTAERPARSAVHVDENAVALTFSLDELQGVHPRSREERQFVLRVALYAVDGRNLQRADACAAVLLHVPLQVLLVDGRTEPPPTCAGACLGLHFGPHLCPCGSGHQAGRYDREGFLHDDCFVGCGDTATYGTLGWVI